MQRLEILTYHPDISIDTMRTDLDDAERLRLAEQLSYFMVGVQSFYEHDLGLDYIDPDPRPGTQKELPLRIGHLENATERGRTYHLARRLRGSVLSQSVDAVQGLLITNDLGTLEDGSTGIEIFELDVAQPMRGRKLGKALLSYVFCETDADTTIRLDYARENSVAGMIYEKYGFTVNDAIAPQRHGIFDTEHITMETKAGVLQERLGLR